VTVRHLERPAAGDPVGALVFFHGYGGTPVEMIGLLDKIDPERRFHGYLPEAPYRDPDGGRQRSRRTYTSHGAVTAVDAEPLPISGCAGT
jgi:predicted esterase